MLALAAYGPHLWASQTGETSSLAVEIVAAGQVIAWAIFLPMLWRSSWASRIGIVLSISVWLLVAGWLSGPSLGRTLEAAGRVTAIVVLGSTIWAFASRRPPVAAFVHVGLLFFTLGLPALAFLARDFGSGAGPVSHLSLVAFAITTNFHR